MAESLQSKLDRVRKPRVQIKYEVEENGAMVMKELPFVVGVLADLSGKSDKPLPPLRDRKFVNIDRDTFDEVLAGMAPRLAFRVDDKMTGTEGQEIAVELRFKSYDDFSPANVAKQVEPLRKLLETRGKLKDLLNRMDGNDKLEAQLNEIIKNTETRDQLGKALGIGGEGDKGGEEPQS